MSMNRPPEYAEKTPAGSDWVGRFAGGMEAHKVTKFTHDHSVNVGLEFPKIAGRKIPT